MTEDWYDRMEPVESEKICDFCEESIGLGEETYDSYDNPHHERCLDFGDTEEEW